jgi:DNA-binding transcriptional ArsR family regulator
MSKGKFDIFKVIADPTRRKIIQVLLVAGALPISAIAEDFNMTRQAVTKHIVTLEKAGLVKISDNGRERYCTATPAPLKEVFDWVKFYEQFWEEKFVALEEHLNHKYKK